MPKPIGETSAAIGWRLEANGARLAASRAGATAEVALCEGRKPHAETSPNAVLMAKRLHRANPVSGRRRSLRRISAELAAAGFVNKQGKPYHSHSVRRMIEGDRPAIGAEIAGIGAAG